MLLVFLSIWIGTTSNIPMEGVRIPFMLFGTLVVVLGIYSVFKHYIVIRNAVQGMEQKEKESEPVSGTYTGVNSHNLRVRLDQYDLDGAPAAIPVPQPQATLLKVS